MTASANSTDSSAADPEDASPTGDVRYPLPQFARANKRGRRFTVAMFVFMVAAAIWSFSRGNVPLFPIFALAFAAYAQWRIHTRGRDAVANEKGITGPHLRKPILWAEVAELEEPLRYDPQIFVTMSDGTRKGTGFPASYFDSLRALTSVPVKPKSA